MQAATSPCEVIRPFCLELLPVQDAESPVTITFLQSQLSPGLPYERIPLADSRFRPDPGEI